MQRKREDERSVASNPSEAAVRRPTREQTARTCWRIRGARVAQTCSMQLDLANSRAARSMVNY